MKPEKVSVACPKCGHTQQEPSAAYSSSCKKCGQYFRLQDLNKSPAEKNGKAHREMRRVACFSCATELDVPVSAQSTMCKRCSSHVDLRDYNITSTVSKNFRTRGRFVLEESGYLLNTDSFATEVVLKGRLQGKLAADIFHIYPTAEIRGSFEAGKMVIPQVTNFRWPKTIRVQSAEIAGEVAGNLHAAGTILLRSGARLFGNIVAAGLVIESGAIWVGQSMVGAIAREEEPAAPLLELAAR